VSSNNCAQEACHICPCGTVEEIASYPSLTRIASDSTVWKMGGRLGICTSCGAVQKPITPEWKAEATEIYRRYNIYHVSGGTEQQVFADGASLSRSVLLVEFLKQNAPALPEKARHLDIGCGNGAFLRGLSSVFPSWDLFGSEVSEKYKSTVTSIPGVRDFYTQDLREIPGLFDSISLVHVLEHIASPVSFLAEVRSKLAPGGVLFVEIPYFIDNPFDLLIADHSTHFTPKVLAAVLNRSGFSVNAQSHRWVAKELSLVATPGPTTVPAGEDTQALKERIEVSIEWLRSVLSLARSGKGKIGIFGTSNAAAWLYGELRGEVQFFVDEDKTKIGKLLHGKPIFSPEEAPRDAPVVFPLPYPIASEVSQRLEARGVKFEKLLPPRL
jgi:SAM-dependent methyltransferase